MAERTSQHRRSLRGPLAVACLLAGVIAAVLWAMGVFDGDDATVVPAQIADAARDPGSGSDPFAYTDARSKDFVDRATLGYSHVLYEKSPGGIVASARRTARWRGDIERAAAAHGVDPDLMEAIVLLESAGRPEVIAGDDPEAASGLAQIVASTGIDLLGMRIDLPQSQALTRRIAATGKELAKASARANSPKAKVRNEARKQLRQLPRKQRSLAKQRRAVDERFQPQAALDGMGNYLEMAQKTFGTTDLATESYHMGIGNLETVIDRYVGPDEAGDPVGDIVSRDGLDYPQLFFDSSPLVNPRSWDLLASFGDDSSTYLWRVFAAEQIMSLYRTDRPELERLDELNSDKATAEEVFHPESSTKAFDDPDDIQSALGDGDLVSIPDGADFGFRVGPQLGELAKKLDVDPALYASLRPEALATLIYMSARVREIDGGKGTLTVTSAVRDQGYQDALVGINSEATAAYSLHTTGYSFDILRKYRSDDQAQAFQFMLDRLRALAVIDYAVEPEAIHITVSDGAAPLLG
jgi:hypothetical protein